MAKLTVLPLACLLGCSPTPQYPPAAQPVIGTIYDEETLTIAGGEQAIELFEVSPAREHTVRISIPQGAYPEGTQVTIRMAADFEYPSPGQLAVFILANNYFPQEIHDLAVQVLPADVVPATPLAVEVKGTGEPWGFDILHALESEQTWDIVQSGIFAAFGPDEPDNPILRFNITSPGLWTVALPSIPQLQGRLERKELSCGSSKVENPAPATLILEGSSYVWTRQNQAGCTVTTTGLLTFRMDGSIHIEGPPHDDLDYDFDLVDGGIAGIRIKNWDLDDCKQIAVGMRDAVEHYVLAGSQDLPLPKAGTTCPAGDPRDAGRD
jgi:hypothetical protein